MMMNDLAALSPVSMAMAAVAVLIASIAAAWGFGAARIAPRSRTAEPSAEMRLAQRCAALEHELNIQTARLAEAQEQSESLRKTQMEFLSELSHAMRTPMTTMIGYADLLQDATIDQEGRMAAAQGIRRAGYDLRGLLSDVADLAQMEAGLKMPTIAAVPLLDLLKDALHVGRERAVGTGLKMELAVPERLPRAIITDADRLRQIMATLLTVAVDSSDQGVVSMTVSSDQGYLRVVVAYPSAIARSESRVDGEKSFTSGTSLSLAIAQRWARLLGGSLNAVAAGPEAAEFQLIVDAGAGEDIPQAPTRDIFDAPAPVASDAALSGMMILLAEDAPDNQRLIQFILRHAGAEVSVAADGREAVRLALAGESDGCAFDAILMDMSMPEMDGYDAARTLRQNDYRKPIIALTAHVLAGDREKCLAAGCTAYLSKPLDRTRLIALLQSLRVGQSGSHG